MPGINDRVPDDRFRVLWYLIVHFESELSDIWLYILNMVFCHQSLTPVYNITLDPCTCIIWSKVSLLRAYSYTMVLYHDILSYIHRRYVISIWSLQRCQMCPETRPNSAPPSTHCHRSGHPAPQWCSVISWRYSLNLFCCLTHLRFAHRDHLPPGRRRTSDSSLQGTSDGDDTSWPMPTTTSPSNEALIYVYFLYYVLRYFCFIELWILEMTCISTIMFWYAWFLIISIMMIFIWWPLLDHWSHHHDMNNCNLESSSIFIFSHTMSID